VRYCKTSVAQVLSNLGKYDEAETMYTECLEAKKKTLRLTHQSTLVTMNNLAGVLKNLGKYTEARAMYNDCLELQRNVLGESHPHTLVTIKNLESLG
jgi:tetratricopeptide (TPR) repeat protein